MKIGPINIINEIKKVLRILRRWEREGIKVAESPEVAAFREQVSAGLDNIAADIQRLLNRATGLSEEDKASLQGIADRIKAVSEIVPE